MRDLIRITLAAVVLCQAISAQTANPMYSVTSWSAAPPLTSGMTSVNLGDDELSGVISPPSFAFPYFGEMYTSFRIGSNGYILIGGSGTTTAKTPSHNTTPGLCIAPFWGDLVPIAGTSQAQWLFDNLTGKLTVKWGQHEVRNGGPNSPAAATLSLQLRCGTGEILFWYGKVIQDLGSGGSGNGNPVYGAISGKPHTIAISGPSGTAQEIVDGYSYLPGQINADGSVAQYPLTGRPPEVHIQFMPTPEMLTIGTMQTVSGISGCDYSFQFDRLYGVGNVHWTATGLPPGWVMGDDGVLFAAAQHAITGQYTFDVVVTDSDTPLPNTRTHTFTINIYSGPLGIFTPLDLPVGNAGNDYATQFAALGGQPPFAWTATGLPAGYTLAPTGLLSALGADVIAGDYTFDVVVTDGLGNTAAGTFHLRIDPAALDIIAPATLPPGVEGHEYRFSFAGDGGFAPYRWEGISLPMAWTVNALTGELVIPAGAGLLGVHAFSIELTDSDAVPSTRLEHFSLEFLDAPLPLLISDVAPPHARISLGYNQQFYASGGIGPYAWAATGLPTGWQFSATGRLTGIAPATPGEFQFTLEVTDAQEPSAHDSREIVLIVDDASHPPLEITTASLPNGKTGEPYSAVLMATGGGAGDFQWTLTAGSLPSGVDGLPARGTPGAGLYGTPAQVGTFIIYVMVTDAAGQTATKQLSMRIDEGVPVPTTTLSLGSGASTGCNANGDGGWALAALLPLLALALRRRKTVG